METNLSRRGFLTGAAAAGALGAILPDAAPRTQLRHPPFPETQMDQGRRQTAWHGDTEEDPAAGPEYQEAQAATEHAGSGAREKARAPEEENSFLQGKIPPRR